MKHGFVKVMTATPEIRVADCAYNASKIFECMQTAHEKKVDILALPELCVTGCTCGDLFGHKVLIDATLSAIKDLISKSSGLNPIVVVGAPFAYSGAVYNCAFVIKSGTLLGIIPKSSPTNYSRIFSPAPAETIDVELCDTFCRFGTDMLFTDERNCDFSFAVEIGTDAELPVSPSVFHAQAGALIIVNPFAGEEIVGAASARVNSIKALSKRLTCGYVAAGAGVCESTTDMVFSGHSIISENGKILAQSSPFSMESAVSDIDLERLTSERQKIGFTKELDYQRVYFKANDEEFSLDRHISRMPFIPEEKVEREERSNAILDMQARALARRLSHVNAKCAVIGISGGLDSCLALLVSARAMDILGRSRTDILAVTMPCFGTTKRTRSNAEILCDELGVSFKCVDITDAVKQHFKDIELEDGTFDVTFENSQARERTQVLMDISNRMSGLVVGTGDLSELALGWATYNGDHMSMYGVNADVPKTLVRHLVLNFADNCGKETLARTLRDIVDTPVSPELLPHDEGEIAQKTEDLVGPYELHDFFLYYMLRFGFGPKRIFLLAKVAFRGIYDDETILKWLKTFHRRFFAQQFKRSCLPDGIKIGTVGVSPRGGFCMPSDAYSTAWLAEIDEIK